MDLVIRTDGNWSLSVQKVNYARSKRIQYEYYVNNWAGSLQNECGEEQLHGRIYTMKDVLLIAKKPDQALINLFSQIVKQKDNKKGSIERDLFVLVII